VRKKVEIGVILLVVLCAVLLLASRLREAPVPATLPHAGAPDAPPTDPAPLADRELTEEERVLRLARVYLKAWDEWEFERVWELLSEPARNVWSEILEAGEHEDQGLEWSFKDRAEKYDAARFKDPRELFLSAAKRLVETPSAFSRVNDEAPGVDIGEDYATVTWSEAELQMHLSRKGRDWRVHLLGGLYPGFELVDAPGGRKVPVFATFGIFRKDQADLDAWWPRLPRLQGDGPVEPDTDGEIDGIRLYVDSFGGVKSRGRRPSPEELLEFLFQRAEWQRDWDHPQQPATVKTVLDLDRGLPAGSLRDLLLQLTDPEVRMMMLHVAARFSDTPPDRPWYACGLDLHLDPVVYLTTAKIRARETATDLLIRDVEEARFGEDLTKRLTDLPAPDRRKGVRVRCGPNVPAERFLQVLHVLAQQEDLRVVLDIREEKVPESRWGLELDGKPVRLPTLSGKVKTWLNLEVWR